MIYYEYLASSPSPSSSSPQKLEEIRAKKGKKQSIQKIEKDGRKKQTENRSTEYRAENT